MRRRPVRVLDADARARRALGHWWNCARDFATMPSSIVGPLHVALVEATYDLDGDAITWSGITREIPAIERMGRHAP